MRRILAAILLVALMVQTSGGALASTPDENVRPSVEFMSAIASLREAVFGSQLYAAFTGTLDNYAAVHQPAPHVRHYQETVQWRSTTPSPQSFRPVLRPGTARHFVMPPLSALREHRRDPLAMKGPMTRPGPIRFGRQQQPGPTTQRLGPTLFHASDTDNASMSSAATAETTMTATPAPGPNGTTGINHWWTYEERPIPGIGQAMVNAGTGNLIVAATDVDVHELGIDLAFRRVYNSQSQHDVNSDDGGDKAIYGNQWTNNFDANMVYDKTTGTITVYDIDGTQCTYTPNGGSWKPCTGEYATLAPTDATDCTYALTKTNGTIYWFAADDNGNGSCSISQGKKGHLEEILARNNNNNITFTYKYASGGQGSEYISEIDAVHSDGDELKLLFGPPNTTCTVGTAGCWNELGSVKRPDGSVVSYSYGTNGNLTEVDELGNDTSSTRKQTYGYNGYLTWACGPRCTAGNSSTEGAELKFDLDASQRVTDWHEDGVLNVTPSDGLNVPLDGKGSATAWTTYFVGYFYYTGATPSNCGANVTNPGTMFCDGDDHATKWTLDTSYRVTETQDFAEGSTWIPSWEWWDANNNLIKTQDANLNLTQYAYDTNGNTIEVQEPTVTDYVGSPSFNGTSYYSYDTSNNVIAYCDPLYNQAHSNSFVSSTSDSLCPSTVGTNGSPRATVYTYSYPGREPFGCLTDTYTPMGYHYGLTYTGGYCGIGLPNEVQGDPITGDNGRQPTQIFGYDGQGNLTSYSKGGGAWTLHYDALNRQVAVTDPTSVWSYTCYNADDSISAKESALQHQLDNLAPSAISCGTHADQYGHDVDGNVIQEVRHFNGNNANNITKKWYDGFDRLVEVQLPADGNIDNNQNGLTRYIYDLTQNGSTPSLAIYANGSNMSGNFPGYGNLYKTQECLGAPCTWTDVNGNAYDGLDRSITRYQYAPSSSGTGTYVAGQLGVSHTAYDGTAGLGLIDHTIDPIKDYTYFKYDGLDRVLTKTFSGPDATSTAPQITPNRQYQYDEDGHQVTQQFTGPESGWKDTYAYDADGRETSYAEGNGGNTSAPATVNYGYFADGTRKALSITTNSGLFNNPVFQYSYQTDGERTSVSVAGYGAFSWTYDAADRVKSQSDPYTGNAFSWGQLASGTLVAKKMAYDATTGELTSLTFPDGAQYSSMTQDPEGNITGFSVTPPSNWSAPGDVPPTSYVSTVQMAYDVRGELVSMNGNSPLRIGESMGYEVVEQNQYIHGHPCNQVNPNLPLATQPPPCPVDPNNGSGMSNIPLATKNCTYGGNLTFDIDGRITANAIQENGSVSNNCAVGLGAQTSDTREYDAENHTVDDNCAYVSLTVPNQCTSGTDNQYGWGPNEKLRTNTQTISGPGIQPTTSVQTLHWDGDDLLFVTNGDGKLQQVNIEKLGAIVTNTSGTALTVVDRDYAGMEVGFHGTSTAQEPNVLPSHGLNLNPKFSDLTDYVDSGFSSGLWVDMKRNDGYQVGGLTIQGVRAYDPGAGQWSTPDAYKGDVHDPMSQRAYMWNDNNPIQYSDPSGYCPNAATCTIEVLTGLAATGARVAIGATAAAAAPAAAVGAAVGAVLAPAPLADDSQKGYEASHPGYAAESEADLPADQVPVGDTRSTDSKELAGAGLDPHDVKREVLGSKAQISRANIRIEKKTGEVVVVPNGSKVGIKTGYTIGPKKEKK